MDIQQPIAARTAEGGMIVCYWCDALNEETSEISVTEIRIRGYGYFNFGIPIIHCPACGTKLKRYSLATKEEA